MGSDEEYKEMLEDMEVVVVMPGKRKARVYSQNAQMEDARGQEDEIQEMKEAMRRKEEDVKAMLEIQCLVIEDLLMKNKLSQLPADNSPQVRERSRSQFSESPDPLRGARD